MDGNRLWAAAGCPVAIYARDAIIDGPGPQGTWKKMDRINRIDRIYRSPLHLCPSA